MLDLSNVNYSEVSRRTLLSLSFVSLIFRGKRRPSTDATLKISQALSEMLGTPVSMEHLHLALAKKRTKEKKMAHLLKISNNLFSNNNLEDS